MRHYRTPGRIVFEIVNTLIMLILALLCLLPMVHIIAVSFSDAIYANSNSVLFWPKGFNTISYELVFTNSTFIHAFLVSVVRTIAGLALDLFMTMMAAYPLHVNKRELYGRNVLSWIFILPMLLHGGLIPSYLVNYRLGLVNNYLIYILPGCADTFRIVLMMNFFRGLSPSLRESASMDGASEFTILFRIMLPLSMASVATIGLFSAVGHWNEWFTATIYMNDSSKWPLQTLMRSMLKSIDISILDSSELNRLSQASNQSFRSAQVMFATVPILVVYPFAQRYFISGMTIGSVKE